MTSVYVGVCKTRDDERFKKSLSQFTNQISEKYSVCMHVVRDTFLPDAQNKIANDFLVSNYDYLLLLDDDHWGHTPEMLDTLIGANAYMATIKSYSRHYPYSCCLMKRIRNTYAGIENGEGYQEVDFTGFPMTLLRKDLFQVLEAPYFRAKVEGLRTWTTDEPFCKVLAEKGIKPIGCFQHTLPHGDITEENVRQLRYEQRLQDNNLGLYQAYSFKKLQGVL
jgi:hypothetical protein